MIPEPDFTLPEPRPRKRFQIHLSTAVVMMFVAGVLLWANFTPHTPPNEPLHSNYAEEMDFFRAETNWISDICPRIGWPLIMRRQFPVYTTRSVENFKLMDPVSRQDPPKWYWQGIVTNSLIALTILFAVWYLCEWLIRWRVARKDGDD